jgi:nicotinate-nucleotide adenylyltransferase
MNQPNKLNDGKKIGILGGTFNPIHSGHINIAKSALSECNLDEVWFIPNGCPPHKSIDDNISAISRFKMVSSMISNEDKFYINDIELSSIEYNYTHETLKKLSEQFPNNKYYFIMGEDSLNSFDTWKKPELICKYASIIVAVRSENNKSLAKLVTKYAEKYNGEFIFLNCDYIDISSTKLREDVNRLPLDKLDNIESNTVNYIKEHMLYEECDYNLFVTVDDIKKDLEKELKPSRYNHTLGVMYTAINLGMKYDIPLKLCEYAGLLHDAAKSFSKDELVEFCEENGIEITDSEYKAPHLLHSKVGAYIARYTYNITDERILNAILSHTTGRPGMSLLEQIVFVADYIEPNRSKANRLNEIRAMAYYNIDIATAMILQDTIGYLKDINAFIDDTTIKTFEYYKNII